MQGLLDSCIRNIYQAREIKDGRPAFQVGPTCYRGTWAADGPFILEAITYLGRADEVRAGLEQQVDEDSGPGGVEFSKKTGLRLWMVRRHAQLTGDREWLQRMWPRVEREVNQIVEYRKTTRNDPKQANFGLMPDRFRRRRTGRQAPRIHERLLDAGRAESGDRHGAGTGRPGRGRLGKPNTTTTGRRSTRRATATS